MLKKIVIAGSAAAVVLGAGTAALAASSSSPSSSSPSASAGAGTAKAKAGHAKRSELRRALHASWVTRDRKGSTSGSTGYVTHDAIRGQITAVSATSITVKAADNVSETFVVNGSTKIHTRAAGKGVAGTMSQLKTGDKVLVAGTGTSTLTATQVVGGSK